MFKWIIFTSLLFFSINTEAHQPDLSSTMLVQQGDNWVLQIRAALTGFEYEVHHQFGKDSYKTPEEFQDLVLQRVQENVSITFDGNTAAVFEQGQVRLGHETNVIFAVKNVPENFETVKFKNATFSDIYKNQSALFIVKDGYDKKQFVLNNDNLHTAEVKVKDNKFELLNAAANNTSATAKSSFMPAFAAGLGMLVIAGAVFFMFKKRTSS